MKVAIHPDSSLANAAAADRLPARFEVLDVRELPFADEFRRLEFL